MQITTKTNYLDFLCSVNVFKLKEKDIETIFKNIKDRPLIKEFDKNFEELIFGQLCDLQQMETMEDLFLKPFKIILDMDRKVLMKHKAVDCLRFVLYVKEWLEKITKLFKSIEYKPSGEEIQAGIKSLNHGFFGTADWYARRMGIADHEEVFQTNWMRIYSTLKIDHENNRFEKNYRKVIDKKRK